MNDPPPPPPPPPVPVCLPPPAPGLQAGNSSQVTLGPRPQTPMKRLQWVKIPEVKVKNSVNLWTNAMKMFPRLEVNFDRVEALFSCRTQNHLLNHSNHHNGHNGFSSSDPSHPSAFNCQRSEGLLGFPRDNSRDSVDGSSSHWEKRRKYEEVNLLDPKRSMNVNIFIRQLRLSNLELVEKLRQCNSEFFDIETLKTLARLAPDEADKSILSGYKGDPDRLGTAEKFYLSLMSLPNFDLIIQTLLLKEEFYQSLDLLKPAIDSVIVCSKVVKESKAFHEVMYLVLLVGNFLNAGAYSGDAAAFKLCSLLQLIEIKANDNKLHLMHYVAQEIDSKDSTLIEQLEELKYLSNDSIHNISSLFSDMKSLKDDFTNNNRKLLSSSQIDDETKRRLQSMETAINAEMAMLETEAKDVESLRIDLAKYFCEDENTFKLDECMTIVNSFCKHFLHAHEENKERKLQNEKAELKRLERQKTTLQRRLSSASGPSPIYFNPGDSKSTSSDSHGIHNRLTPTHSRSRSASCTRGSGSEGCNSLTEIAGNTNDSHLIDVLLRPSPNGDKGFEARKFNSLRSNKRRSKNVAELWDRERFSLPLGSESQKLGSQSASPNNLEAVQSTYNSTADRAEQNNSNLSATGTTTTSQGLIRNSFARSSCPSRVQNSDKFHHNPTSRKVMPPIEGNKDSENDRVEVRQTLSKKADLDRRLSREVAIGAASFEQQIRELESSLDYFDKDFDLNKTIDNYKNLNASANESHKVPRIRLSSPEKLGVKQNSNSFAETNKSTANNDCKNSKGMRERFMKLTQLYSGKEPLEVQLHKPSTFGREVKASEVEGHNLRGILRDPRHAHTNLNYDKHLSETSECNMNFKDEGFDSEGVSNTSASQKSSRSSSRERDSGQIDWSVRINGEDKTHSHQALGSSKKDPNKPEDSMSTASSNHNFDRSIESLVSKELTVVDCSDINKTLKKEAQEADRTPVKNKNPNQKQMNLNSNQSSSKITGSMLPSRTASKSDNNNVKVPNTFSVANKLSAMLSRTASKPASRVTAYADTKKPIVKTENKRRIEGSNTSRLMTPINKARSLSRQTQRSSPKLSRDSSAKSGHTTIKGCSKTSPRSSSMTGTRTPRSVSTVKAGPPSISSQKRPSVGSTTSTISSDTSTKITHVSRDTKPKIIKPSQSTQLSKLSSRNSPLSTPQSSSSSTSTSITDRRRTPSTCSTTTKALPMNSIFNRQSATRSTLPAKLLSSSTKASSSSRESKISDASTPSKLVRPVKPNMNATNSLATSRCTSRKPEMKSLKF